jgi:HD-GYP domain-containing protein (c-di-GMP phosphodiesterase class II)/DNA-binding CsgD family transcriptional regulator
VTVADTIARVDPPVERLRVAELIAALSLATDLGLGQPMSHVLRTCLIAVHLGRALGLAEEQLEDTYYATLLRFVGCTADSHDLVDFAGGEDVRFRQLMVAIGNDTPEEIAPALVQFMTAAGAGGDIPTRVREALESTEGIGAQIAAVHCDVATMLAHRLGLGPTVCHALRHAFERWDGRGFPEGRSGDDVPWPIRLAAVARDIEVLTRTRGLEATRATLARRRDHALDPRVVEVFLAHSERLMHRIENGDVWTEVLRDEPGGPKWIPARDIDQALTAFADFADAKTPFTLGHSRGVAELAHGAAVRLGMSPRDAITAQRAGLLHDIGRSGVENAIWEHPGPLSVDQWEHVRLHVYYTERILVRCDCLRPLSAIAAAHHERLDGSGYHRGSRASDLDGLARVLAAADACQAMLQNRPHRPARLLDAAARELRREVADGKLDAHAVEAVLATAGAPARPTMPHRPGNLTDRQVEVLRLLARGHSNREMGSLLGITPKTVGHHVQHIYDKLGVSTRAAAAIFAVENHLLNP